MKNAMAITTPRAMLFHSSRTTSTCSPFVASSSSSPSRFSSLSPRPPLWTSVMDRLLQRPNAYLKNLETAGILLPPVSSSSSSSSPSSASLSPDFAYVHLNESTSRRLSQPHFAQAAARQLVGMYQHDYAKLHEMQTQQHDELALQQQQQQQQQHYLTRLARLEVPLTALVQLMKFSQHFLIPPDNNSMQHNPALWHDTWQTLQRDIYLQRDRSRRNHEECGKMVALTQQGETRSKKTTSTNTNTKFTDRDNQDVQWKTRYWMRQLLQQRQLYKEQEEHDGHNHGKSDNDNNNSNRLDWLREVQQDLISSIKWQPHQYEQYPMDFRYKPKNRTQRLELIRRFYNLIGLRQTLATSTDNRNQEEQQEPYKHYADQIFRSDCHRRLAPSVETVESFLKATSLELKAYLNATSSALPIGGALSEFIQPQRREQIVLRQRQKQQQQHTTSLSQEIKDAVNNEGAEELQLDTENQQDTQQQDLPDEEKMLQLHHHVTLDGALDFAFRLSRDLFGIAIVQEETANGKQARFWNDDVRLYHIYNHDDDDDDDDIRSTATKLSKQQYMGSFFLDPYQRPGKMRDWSGHIPLYATAASCGAMGGAGNEKSDDVIVQAKNADDDDEEEDAATAGHAGAVVVISLQLEPPVWSHDSTKITWCQAQQLFSQLGYTYQWILSTKSSLSLTMSLAKSPENMPVDLIAVIPKFMEHWLYEKSTIYALLLAASAQGRLPSSLANFTDGSIDAALRVLSRQKALELSRHVYYAAMELAIFSDLNVLQNGGGDETIMALQNRLAREMLPTELFAVLCDNEDDLTPLCHVLCSDAASESQAVAWYRHVWADAVSAHILQELQEVYDNARDNMAKTLVMKRWRQKFRNVLLDRGAAVDVDEFKREFGLQDVLRSKNNNDDDDDKEGCVPPCSLHGALFRRYVSG